MNLKIGRLQVCGFKNIILGSQYGKVAWRPYIRIYRHGAAINFFGYCIRFDVRRKWRFPERESISIEEFAAMMKKNGVDLSKSQPVEMYIEDGHIKTSPIE